MPVFLKEELTSESSGKYSIILADTGMGKTAFLINLFRRYKKLPAHRAIYDIRMFPLGAKDALLKIKQIEEKQRTILLLDAFDEDIQAVNDYSARMTEILDSVRDFRKVIFTCRTQFFPTKEEEPLDTDDLTFGDNIQHKIRKLYLSAFDNADIFRYLIKKYNLNIISLYRAYNLVRKCPSLMFRPMLLTYIDDLLHDSPNYDYTFQMYQVLIDKWIEREAQKPAVASRRLSNGRYAKSLLEVSVELSVNLYEQRGRRQGYFVTISDLKRLLEKKIVDPNVLTVEDKTGRSLLNRNSIGQFKFAHKSIMEYFLALHLFEKPEFLTVFDFQGMDATRSFHSEMLVKDLSRYKGFYQSSGHEKRNNLQFLNTQWVQKIEHLTLTKASTIENHRHIAGLQQLISLVVTDPDFLSLYVLYIYIVYDKLVDSSSFKEETKGRFKASLEDFRTMMREVERWNPNLSYVYIIKLLENCEIEKDMRIKLFAFLQDISNEHATTEGIIRLDAIRKQILAGRSEMAIVANSFEHLRRLQHLREPLPQVTILL